jgi:hypothetical protein
MRKILLLFALFSSTTTIFSQSVTGADSIYIYKHFLFFNPENRTFDDIDEPFIEEYWLSQNVNAKRYFYLSTFLRSIPVSQRVILLSYLDNETKVKSHLWIYHHLTTRKDTTEYFNILNSEYGIPYIKLNIPRETLLKYCKTCNYK